LPVRDRWRNPAVGPMDGCLGQAIVVKLVCRGACREFSDYNFEGPGGPSGWARLRHRTDALRQRPDVKRIGLDRPDAAVRRARTKALNFCRCICAAGRPRLVHHGWGKAVPGFAGSADPRPRRRAGATVRTLRDGRHRTEPGPADTSTGCRQHAHLAAGSRSGRNAAICVIGIAIGYYKWAAKAVRELAAHLRRLSRTRWSLRRRYLGRRVCGPSSRSTVCAAAGA